jgi:hypothetical protein
MHLSLDLHVHPIHINEINSLNQGCTTWKYMWVKMYTMRRSLLFIVW